MSRPLRIEYEGAWYHVMNRGRGRQVVFPRDNAYEAFLQTVAEAWQRFNLQVHAYCLMPNHYHLLVCTPDGNLSRCMRHVDGVYTQRHNRLIDTDGPLFRGRYKAILVDADAYLLSVSRYIHRNPIDASRPLINELRAWPWSSYPAYINEAKLPPWLHRQAIFDTLGRRDRYRGYRLFVEAGVEAEISDYYANQRIVPILGDKDFREWALSQTPPAGEVPRYQRRGFVEPEQVFEVVVRACGVTREALTARGRPGKPVPNHARQLAMLACRERTGLTLAEIGKLFGGIGYGAVSENLRRCKERMRRDHELTRQYKYIMCRLDP